MTLDPILLKTPDEIILAIENRYPIFLAQMEIGTAQLLRLINVNLKTGYLE
jgi:hypothetical protein